MKKTYNRKERRNMLAKFKKLSHKVSSKQVKGAFKEQDLDIMRKYNKDKNEENRLKSEARKKLKHEKSESI